MLSGGGLGPIRDVDPHDLPVVSGRLAQCLE